MTSNTELYILTCSSNSLTDLEVSGLSWLSTLNCSFNNLTELNLSGTTFLNSLDCSSNRLSSLDLTDIDLLSAVNCKNNRLPFSSLATFDNDFIWEYTYIPQDTIFEKQSLHVPFSIDYSAEALIIGVTSEFDFYKNDTLIETNNTGILDVEDPGYYYCKMTNNRFPGLILTTALTTALPPSELTDANSEADFGCYPNPTTGMLNISFDQDEMSESYIMIFNLQGNMLFSETIHGSTKSVVDLTEFQSGLYLMKVIAEEISYEEKILKK